MPKHINHEIVSLTDIILKVLNEMFHTFISENIKLKISEISFIYAFGLLYSSFHIYGLTQLWNQTNKIMHYTECDDIFILSFPMHCIIIICKSFSFIVHYRQSRIYLVFME